MKNLLFLLTLLICKVTVSQHVTQLELFSFKSIDKIPKKIQFTYSKNTQKSLIIIKGHNQKNSHRQSCSWESKLDIDKISLFLKELESSAMFCRENVDVSWINSNYQIMLKRKDKIRVSFESSKCNRKHKTTYFQKNCNRSFSFLLTKEIALILVESINSVLQEPVQANIKPY